MTETGWRTRRPADWLTDGWRARVASALVASCCGLLGAGLVGIVTSTPPELATALAAVDVAVGEQPRDVPGPVVVCDYWCPEWDGRDDVVAYDAPVDRTDFVRIVFDPPSEQALAMATAAHQRLVAAGWRIDGLVRQGDQVGSFQAVDGRTRLSVTANAAVPQDTASFALVVSNDISAPVVLAVAAGSVGGLLLGWLGCGWVLRRFRLHRTPVRFGLAVAGVPALLIALLASGVAVVLLVAVSAEDEWTATDVRLPALLVTLAWPVFLTFAAVVVVSSALAALPSHRVAGTTPTL
nr:hypothetical protein [Micromonospora sp. DSM 115978]